MMRRAVQQQQLVGGFCLQPDRGEVLVPLLGRYVVGCLVFVVGKRCSSADGHWGRGSMLPAWYRADPCYATGFETAFG